MFYALRGLHMKTLEVTQAKKQIKTAALAAALLLATACSPKSSEQKNSIESTTSTGIVGGKIVEDQDQIRSSTVYLMMFMDKGMATCTGSIIDKNIILTAAHCVADNPRQVIVLFSKSVPQSNEEILKIKSSARPATNVVVFPLYEKRKDLESDHTDIALIKFAGEIPADYKVAKLHSSEQKVSEKNKITLSGYGLTDGIKKTSSKELRKTEVIAVGETATEIIFDQSATGGACSGDSGGPSSFDIDGQEFVFGVASRVGGPDKVKDICAQYAVYTKIEPFKKWIATVIESLNTNTRTKK